MTPEQQNAAIAQACGWMPTPNGHYTMDPAGLRGPFTHPFNLPDYLIDLNAMHEAEKRLTDDQWDHYCELLGGSLRHCASATAAQRAEAFLRTIGKWTE